MSPKELMYVEDALGHVQFMLGQCKTAAQQLQDENLKAQVQQLADKNRQTFQQFYSLV